MFFRGLGGYAKMSDQDRADRRELFDIADKKTQRRWWKKYFQLMQSSSKEHANAARYAFGKSGGRRRSAEEKELGL